MMDNKVATKKRSPWVYIVLFFVLVFFGLFWFIESKRITTAPSVSLQKPEVSSSSLTQTTDLEAAVSAITISDYSDAF